MLLIHRLKTTFMTWNKISAFSLVERHNTKIRLTIHIERKPTPSRPHDAESSPDQRIKWDDSRITSFRAGLLNKSVELDTFTNTVSYQT